LFKVTQEAFLVLNCSFIQDRISTKFFNLKINPELGKHFVTTCSSSEIKDCGKTSVALNN
jgi:hypothetical protein